MLWLVPHLFPDPRLQEIAAHGLQTPGLLLLLARGTLTAEPGEGTEAALCRALGVARQQDWPLAPITLEADGASAGDAYWLRADPAYFQVMRDRIVLADTGVADLTSVESDALAASIVEHFGDGLPLRAPHPQRWYLRCDAPLRVTTTPPSLATGRAIDAVLPRGEDAQALRVKLNELQMLLHTHPVNQAREARGALPVNTLWVWGGGLRPAACGHPLPVYAQGSDTQAIAAHCGAPLFPLPSTLDKAMLGKPGIVVLDALVAPACTSDAIGWREAMQALERNWFAPLAGALRATGKHGIRIFDPVSGRGVCVRRIDAWKIWRRSRELLLLAV